ncbi:MAG TPA: hypothetical protein VFF58_00550 [Candidatus Nitrosotalea sp.]|nr:hypothetical protein [Candidatus Nitrosotalea sp.]
MPPSTIDLRMCDASERRARLNPGVMHAIALLENCGDNVSTAQYLANFQLQCCAVNEFRHWLEVSSVLSGELGGRA